ncbi:MAG TPA: signal peptidase I [Candidatus Saccharimonadales bacterium]|nr:signal peptidase I [Candidatus Saccharimonadales bacterium]
MEQQPTNTSNPSVPPVATPQSEPQTPMGFDQSPTTAEDPKNHEGLKSVLKTISFMIIAPLIAFTMTAYVFQSYEVDGPSMETTLQNQDRLIVLKLPRTLARVTGHDFIPHRGDVIIFNKKGSLETGDGGTKQLIKRVIGLPGERVVVKDGTLKVYNKDNPDGFQPDTTLPYGRVISTTPGDIELTVQDGQVFVCGDNRANSLDSRYFGAVEADEIVGKLAIRIFPFNKAKIF